MWARIRNIVFVSALLAYMPLAADTLPFKLMDLWDTNHVYTASQVDERLFANWDYTNYTTSSSIPIGQALITKIVFTPENLGMIAGDYLASLTVESKTSDLTPRDGVIGKLFDSGSSLVAETAPFIFPNTPTTEVAIAFTSPVRMDEDKYTLKFFVTNSTSQSSIIVTNNQTFVGIRLWTNGVNQAYVGSWATNTKKETEQTTWMPKIRSTYFRKEAQQKIDLLKEVSYEELVGLKEAKSLIPGQQYAITNYDTTTTQSGTQAAYHHFDVIVTADSTNTLNCVARARKSSRDTDDYFGSNDLSKWELRYSIANNPYGYAWADPTNGKGVIFWLRDEHGNECPYDFKNILFDAKYTFSYFISGTYKDATVVDLFVNNNIIEPYIILNNGYRTRQLNNIVLDVDTVVNNNRWSCDCRNITLEASNAVLCAVWFCGNNANMDVVLSGTGIYQNVVFDYGVGGTAASPLTITDSNIDQTWLTEIRPADSVVVSVATNDTTIVIDAHE